MFFKITYVDDNMDFYDDKALYELNNWKISIKKKPSIVEKASKGVQNKFNNMLHNDYHEIIT